jgi:hypothetical protein
MSHVILRNPTTLEPWREIMQGTFPGATFRDYHEVFEITEPCSIAARLREILEEFGQGGRNAVFCVSGHDVAGFWLDPSHNYVAIAFKKATGDEFDGALVISIGR